MMCWLLEGSREGRVHRAGQVGRDRSCMVGLARWAGGRLGGRRGQARWFAPWAELSVLGSQSGWSVCSWFSSSAPFFVSISSAPVLSHLPDLPHSGHTVPCQDEEASPKQQEWLGHAALPFPAALCFLVTSGVQQ